MAGPGYVEMPKSRFGGIFGKFRRYEDFPAEFKAYVEFIERETGVPVRIISVGPDRDETIVR